MPGAPNASSPGHPQPAHAQGLAHTEPFCAPKSTGVPEDTSSAQFASGSWVSHSSPTEHAKQAQAWSPSDQTPLLLHAAALRSCSRACVTSMTLC